MPTPILRLDVFISSPSDVAEEREIVLRVVERLNRLPFIRGKYLLNPLVYEDEIPPAVGDPAQLVVDRYMTEAKDSYLVVCILWARMGTPFTHTQTGKDWISGTAYEFTTAYESYRERGTPQILLYRRTNDNPDADREQAARVDEFFGQFRGAGKTFDGLYKRYETTAGFEQMVFEHIARVIEENPPAASATQTVEAVPEVKEEERRLDVAMPAQVSAGRPTEVRVMIAMPGSEGLKGLLPDTTDVGHDIIFERDVRFGALTVAYALNEQGEPLVNDVLIKIHGENFDITQPEQRLFLYYGRNSGQFTFEVTPRRAIENSRLYVTVQAQSPYTRERHLVTLGSATVTTNVQPTGFQAAAKIAWKVMTLSLTAASSTPLTRFGPGVQTAFPTQDEVASPAQDGTPAPEAPPPEPEDSVVDRLPELPDWLMEGAPPQENDKQPEPSLDDPMTWLERLGKQAGHEGEETPEVPAGSDTGMWPEDAEMPDWLSQPQPDEDETESAIDIEKTKVETSVPITEPEIEDGSTHIFPPEALEGEPEEPEEVREVHEVEQVLPTIPEGPTSETGTAEVIAQDPQEKPGQLPHKTSEQMQETEKFRTEPTRDEPPEDTQATSPAQRTTPQDTAEMQPVPVKKDDTQPPFPRPSRLTEMLEKPTLADEIERDLEDLPSGERPSKQHAHSKSGRLRTHNPNPDTASREPDEHMRDTEDISSEQAARNQALLIGAAGVIAIVFIVLLVWLFTGAWGAGPAP